MSSASSPAQTAPSPPMMPRSAGLRWMLLLTVIAAISRLWLLGGDPGEADCARFLIGLRQWVRLGPHAPAMYGSVFSPLYYWLAAHLTHGLEIAPLQAARLLNGLSAMAAIATAPAAYALGCRLTTPRVAFWATLALLATPAVWWLGIETHPQGLSLLGFLLALLCLTIRLQDAPTTGRARLLMLAGVAALTFGLGCKSDLVLLFGAFPALLPALRPDLFPDAHKGWGRWAHDWRRWWPALQTALLLPVLASLFYMLLRSFILQRGVAWLQHDSGNAVAMFLEWPHGSEMIKQLLPMISAFGMLIALVTALGILRALWLRRAETGRLAVLVLAWSLPSVVFWFLIRGNNVRHMADILLPLLWLGLAGWEGLRWPAVPVLVTAALILDLWIIPPSSNLTLYPSANVPGSARDLHLRMQDLRANLPDGVTGTRGPVCYLGNATLPYLELLLWRAHPEATLTLQYNTETLTLTDGQRIHFIEVNSSPQYRQAAAGCPQARSLEYSGNGAHQWFLGEEWGSLPFHQRWYAVRYERGH